MRLRAIRIKRATIRALLLNKQRIERNRRAAAIRKQKAARAATLKK